MIIEMIGYFGSILVLVSFLMSSVVKLRVINSIGGFIFAIYALIIQSYPTAIMNFSLVAINIYYLSRLKKTDDQFELLKAEGGDSLIAYFLNYYTKDIQEWFVGFDLQKITYNTVYFVFCNAVPAGIFLGNKREDGTFVVELEYTTPAYRDCSVGKYLYSKLPLEGVKSLRFEKEAGRHEPYLKKMGYIQENGQYEKKL